MQTASHAMVIIDPQNDFCDAGGSLYVGGAEADIERLASYLKRSGERYGDIFVSLDSHDPIAIFHPKFWVGADGESPAPFTQVTGKDVTGGRWRAASGTNALLAERAFAALSSRGIDSLTIWPEHCIVSAWGHEIASPLKDALGCWRSRGRAVRYVFKGENPFTEQFSIFEGLDDRWPECAFNETLFLRLAYRESVTFAGEALSHCVAASLESYMSRLRRAEKDQDVYLLADCSSPVSGFSRDECLGKIASLGVKIITCE
ncbi:hypothetical protein FACS1894167_03920 [Synergistales bacterium]|nr:hypothetical protein FACS1894167_03920 [Synergistales bacterium]